MIFAAASRPRFPSLIPPPCMPKVCECCHGPIGHTSEVGVNPDLVAFVQGESVTGFRYGEDYYTCASCASPAVLMLAGFPVGGIS